MHVLPVSTSVTTLPALEMSTGCILVSHRDDLLSKVYSEPNNLHTRSEPLLISPAHWLELKVLKQNTIAAA